MANNPFTALAGKLKGRGISPAVPKTRTPARGRKVAKNPAMRKRDARHALTALMQG